MKKFLFLLFTCLLLVALVLPACKAPVEQAKTIKIGVIGPMEYIQGKHHWAGAELARDTINPAGGIKVGEETYQVELIKTDSNEILSTTDAAAAMEKLITVDKADFVIGGFRTEAVFPMQEVAMDYKMIFLNCGAATLQLNIPVLDNYDRYKYYFRVTPFCSNYLVNNVLFNLGMAGAIIKEETGITRPMRVAICAEGAQWADGMVNIMNALIPSKLKMEVSGTWRPSPTATELTAEMTAMEAAKTDIICPIISGPLGIPYARSWGELEVEAASVGINVESQQVPFWEATKGFGNYETSLSSYAPGLEQTPLTKPFFDAFMAKTGEVPTYTAGTYDAIYLLKDAIERAGTLDHDAVVAELEKTDTIGTVSHFVFTGNDAPLRNPHDVTWGPGFATGIATQWQDGKIVAVWPNADYATDDAWKEVKYTGIVKWKAPPRLIARLKAEAATQPKEEPKKEEPKKAGAVSFEANTYNNKKYGFSIQYPKKWEEDPTLKTLPEHIIYFRIPGFVPGVALLRVDAKEPVTADWLVKSFTALGNKDCKILSGPTEITLSDGKTKAMAYKAAYVSATGYDIESYCIDVDKGENRFRVVIYTIAAVVPYDEALFSEIAGSLTFK